MRHVEEIGFFVRTTRRRKKNNRLKAAFKSWLLSLSLLISSQFIQYLIPTRKSFVVSPTSTNRRQVNKHSSILKFSAGLSALRLVGENDMQQDSVQ